MKRDLGSRFTPNKVVRFHMFLCKNRRFLRIIQQSAETKEPHEFVNYGNGIVNLNGPTIGVREFREINLDKHAFPRTAAPAPVLGDNRNFVHILAF